MSDNNDSPNVCETSAKSESDGNLPVQFQIGDWVDKAYDNEGPIDIYITNKLDKNIKIQFHGKRPKEVEILMSDMTRIFTKRPKYGIYMRSAYQCDFWYDNQDVQKHIKMFVYGEKAPRRSNRFEVRDGGVYLVEETQTSRLGVWQTIDK